MDMEVDIRLVTHETRKDAILDEASRGYDLLLLGAHGGGDPFGSGLLEEVVEGCPAHAGVFKADKAKDRFHKLLIPTKGGSLFPFVFEFAAMYMEVVPEASATVLYAAATRKTSWLPWSGAPEAVAAGAGPAALVTDALQSHTQDRGKALPMEQKTLQGRDPVEVILKEARAGNYDLMLVGARKHVVRERLFFGGTVDELARRSPCPVLVLTPRRASGE
jgi:nucleotide-binding universal stress UspA family protein